MKTSTAVASVSVVRYAREASPPSPPLMLHLLEMLLDTLIQVLHTPRAHLCKAHNNRTFSSYIW